MLTRSLYDTVHSPPRAEDIGMNLTPKYQEVSASISKYQQVSASIRVVARTGSGTGGPLRATAYFMQELASMYGIVQTRILAGVT